MEIRIDNKTKPTEKPAPSKLRQVPELRLESYLRGDKSDRLRFIDEFYRGLTEYGFVVIKDHPVPVPLLETAYRLLEALFDLPNEVKHRYALADQGFQRGYTPFGREHAKDSKVSDLKEFWHIGRDLPDGHRYSKLYPRNVWPSELSDFQPTLAKIYRSLDEVAQILLESLTYSLDLPQDYFTRMMSEGNSILRLLHYPPVPDHVDPRCVRAAAHEDINLITILVSATASGLELKDRDGSWLPIESDPNSLIVDSGDMLARITNDIIPSTTHRVVNPESGRNTSRYSMPFFVHPNPDAELSCLPACQGRGAKYPPISAQDFLFQRLKEIGLM